jgi:hypothetical protein
MMKLSKKAMAKLARELRKASWIAASALTVLGIRLHHSVMGVCLGGLVWAITQVLAAGLDSLAGE